MLIFRKVSAYMRFKLLPPSMNTRDTSNPAITAGRINAACPGLGTCGGWSSMPKLMLFPDQSRYSTVGGGIFSALKICREISFCALLEGLPFWIIAIARFGSIYGGGCGAAAILGTFWFCSVMAGGR